MMNPVSLPFDRACLVARLALFVALLPICVCAQDSLDAYDTAAEATTTQLEVGPTDDAPQREQHAPLDDKLQAELADLKRLSAEQEVWIDLKTKRVLLGSTVSCREGMLEMFACPVGTKEYESVLAVHSPAYLVHTALLAIGAKPGKPVQFIPEYRAASGDVINVHVVWIENGEKKRAAGQQFVKNLRTGKAMQQNWVFGGSGFWRDEETGQEFYHAEGGELICVSNFSTAMMDVPIESSQKNNALTFGTFTENIPPLGTRVLIELSLDQ